MEKIDSQKFDEFKRITEELKELNLEKRAAELQESIENYRKETQSKDLWDDQDRAKRITQTLSHQEDQLKDIERLTQLAEDLEFMLAEIKEGEGAYLDDFESQLVIFSNLLDKVKAQIYLSDKYDPYSAYVSIYAGQGGTEANDWAEILLRMYLRYISEQGWKSEIITKQTGSEVGISSVVIKVLGDYAYGYLKVEHGTHRLVRISPFNSQGLRQTTFAGVEVVPVVAEVDEVEIKDDDIDFSAVRSSGAGGQSVNKVATAVRIRHIPTNIIVTSSSERSQLQNRQIAMELLASKLLLLEKKKREKELEKATQEGFAASWGYQIRNYVLHPYKLVKDIRTNVETTDAEAILNGNLSQFINAGIIYLAQQGES